MKTIHRLITEFAEELREGKDTFRIRMLLRAELSVTAVPLPRCLDLIPPDFEPESEIDFDLLAAAAIEELDAAQRTVWSNHTLYRPAASADE